MSYSRRELYALGEPLGDSATELKVNGDRLYGGGGGGKGKKPKRIPIVPANVSTGFGTAVANPQTGQYSYTLDPRLAQMRDIFYGAAPEFMPTEEEAAFAQGVSDYGMGIFGRGGEFLQQALAQDTGDIAQRYYSDVQNLMATDRAQEEARLANTLFKTGRTGVGAGTQGGYVNPEQFSLLRARELANQQLAIQSEDLARARREGDVGFASRLMGTGLGTYGSGKQVAAAPYQTMAGIFGLGTGLEQLGMQPLQIASDAVRTQLAAQAQQQAVENARASGGKGGGLLGAVGNVASIASGFGGLGSIGSGISSIWSGSSPTSGLSSLFGGLGSGWGNANIGTPFGSWTPIDTTISPWNPAGSGYGGTVYPVY